MIGKIGICYCQLSAIAEQGFISHRHYCLGAALEWWSFITERPMGSSSPYEAQRPREAVLHHTLTSVCGEQQ